MRCILLITDDTGRAERIVRGHGASGRWVVYDLFNDDTLPSVEPDLIVSDVGVLSSDAILRLRRALATARRGGVPYLCLLHDNTARGELQARALGASRSVPASAVSRALAGAIGDLAAKMEPAAPATVHKAVEARAFLSRLFKAGEPVTPAAIEAGTAIIDRAIHETGIRDWLEMVCRFDDATHQHCLLVAGLAAAFARDLGLRPEDCHRLTKAALLHDIGKTRIPVAILNKPGRLDEAELRVIRTHPVIGYEMLLGGGFSDVMLAVVRSHHELLDGSGYPDGLKGSQIPDLVRLVTICDIYAALIERRPYKAPMNMDRAYAILVEMGPKLDTDLVRAFRPVTAVFDAPAAMAASA